ncbi:MAG: hypothetical protein A2138_00305 [Deltaproteobacteria bacterium RBG_16_71_12]|nr:MAG: hypothetical protein A2138_00305 [Deltaproteobacteria bacterium RBG_16_71_12]
MVALDATTVRLGFSRALDRSTVAPAAFAIADYTVVPPALVDVEKAAADDDTTVTLTTAPLVAGTRYTLEVKGLKDAQGRALHGTLNFTASGLGDLVAVDVVIADVETARLHDALSLLVTVDEGGAFSDQLLAYPVVDEGSRFVARLSVLADAARTLDPGDDADLTVDRRPFALLLVDGAGRMASSLVTFVVPDASASSVSVDVLPPLEIIDQPETDPLPEPPDDPSPGDGLRVVRVVVDDRASRELLDPELKVAVAADGSFDASFPRTLPLSPMSGDDEGYWEAVLEVQVDPARVLEGTTPETFPYFAYLIEAGAPYESLDVAVVAPDETPATVRLSLGDPEWVPVTFRVDVSRAYLNPSGSQRGHYPSEAIFLTGEWQRAVDALGNNCGDAFSGGENPCLQMRELATHPGVWTRTLWLPGGRPYGWKVVRCQLDVGCGPLNDLVASSGRAFATVMKNLATDNTDAFADADVGIVDPLAPAATQTGSTTRDYSSATVYAGQGIGSEPDPSGTPDGARMFKQEVPDLVVVVDTRALRTRVVHVGSWRDVNLSSTPQQIVEQQLSVALGPFDYDDGFIGRFPPSREEP